MTTLRNLLLVDTHDVAGAPALAYMITTYVEANGSLLNVRSAGLGALKGATLDVGIIVALEQLDELGPKDWSVHQSHQLEPADMVWADLVMCLSGAQHDDLALQYPDMAEKIVVAGHFLKNAPIDASFEEQLATVHHVARSTSDDVDEHFSDEQMVSLLWQMATVFNVVTDEQAL